MTEDRTSGPSSDGASGQPQFIVQHGDRYYRTQVVGEVDQQEQSTLQQAEPAGRAFLDPQGSEGLSFKSMPAAASFANIGDDTTDMAAPSASANIGDEISNDSMAAPSSMANIEDKN